MDQKEIDLLYLKEAYKLAMNSHDPSTQNGAIIVNLNDYFDMGWMNLVAFDWNHFPRGVNANPERLNNRREKYKFIGHAERGAIFSAARNGRKTNGKIMYAPWYACDRCGEAIIEAGISEVIGHSGPQKWWEEDATNDSQAIKWNESIRTALIMFKEAGVKHRIVDGKIGGIEILFRGKIRKP